MVRVKAVILFFLVLFFHLELTQASTPEPTLDISGHWWPSTEESWEWPAVRSSFKVPSVFLSVLTSLESIRQFPIFDLSSQGQINATAVDKARDSLEGRSVGHMSGALTTPSGWCW